MSDIKEVIVPAIKATMKVVLLSSIGTVASRTGIFNTETSSRLSKLVLNFFVPALTFVKVASIVSVDNIVELWPLPVFGLFYVLLGMGLGWLVCKIFRFPKVLHGLIIVCCAFANSQTIPLSMISSLAKSAPQLKESDTDTSERIYSRGASYILLFTLAGTILRWSLAYRLLNASPDVKLRERQREERVARKQMLRAGILPAPTVPSAPSNPSPLPSSSPVDAQRGSVSSADASCGDAAFEAKGKRRLSLPESGSKSTSELDTVEIVAIEPMDVSAPHIDRGDGINAAVQTVETMSSESAGGVQKTGASLPQLPQLPQLPSAGSINSSDGSDPKPGAGSGDAAHSPMPLWKRIYFTFTPPVWAIFLALIVGMIQPVKDLFFPDILPSEAGPGEDTTAPLDFITDTLETLGSAVVPSITLILGEHMARGPLSMPGFFSCCRRQSHENDDDDDDDDNDSDGTGDAGDSQGAHRKRPVPFWTRLAFWRRQQYAYQAIDTKSNADSDSESGSSRNSGDGAVYMANFASKASERQNLLGHRRGSASSCYSALSDSSNRSDGRKRSDTYVSLPAIESSAAGKASSSSSSKKKPAKVVTTRLTYGAILAVMLVKLLLLPAIVIPIVLAMQSHGALPEDPVFVFVILLESCVPTGINLIVIAAVHSWLQKELSTILFYQYLVAVVTMTAVVSAFLYLI